jgi:hypothetical protein
MVSRHRSNRYDRATAMVASLTGHPAQTVESFVAGHAEMFTAGEGQVSNLALAPDKERTTHGKHLYIARNRVARGRTPGDRRR